MWCAKSAQSTDLPGLGHLSPCQDSTAPSGWHNTTTAAGALAPVFSDRLSLPGSRVRLLCRIQYTHYGGSHNTSSAQVWPNQTMEMQLCTKATQGARVSTGRSKSFGICLGQWETKDGRIQEINRSRQNLLQDIVVSYNHSRDQQSGYVFLVHPVPAQ